MLQISGLQRTCLLLACQSTVSLKSMSFFSCCAEELQFIRKIVVCCSVSPYFLGLFTPPIALIWEIASNSLGQESIPVFLLSALPVPLLLADARRRGMDEWLAFVLPFFFGLFSILIWAVIITKNSSFAVLKKFPYNFALLMLLMLVLGSLLASLDLANIAFLVVTIITGLVLYGIYLCGPLIFIAGMLVCFVILVNRICGVK